MKTHLKRTWKNAKALYTSLTAMHTVPKYVEISKNRQPFKVDIKDPNFDRPYDKLIKRHGTNNVVLVTKIR